MKEVRTKRKKRSISIRPAKREKQQEKRAKRVGWGLKWKK